MHHGCFSQHGCLAPSSEDVIAGNYRSGELVQGAPEHIWNRVWQTLQWQDECRLYREFHTAGCGWLRIVWARLVVGQEQLRRRVRQLAQPEQVLRLVLLELLRLILPVQYIQELQAL